MHARFRFPPCNTLLLPASYDLLISTHVLSQIFVNNNRSATKHPNAPTIMQPVYLKPQHQQQLSWSIANCKNRAFTAAFNTLQTMKRVEVGIKKLKNDCILGNSKQKNKLRKTIQWKTIFIH